jgi:putative oxidoreductase
MSVEAGTTVLLGRVLFVIFFGAVAGIGHIRRAEMMKGFARSQGFPIPYLAGWPAGLWLIAASLSILLGVWPDIGMLAIAAFVTPAALFFHRFWTLKDEMQKQTQTQLFYRNMIALGASLMMFGMFVTLGPELRFTITAPLLSF